MEYIFPFGEKLRPLVQEDRSPKKVFVLGVYASAVHARWKRDGKIVCQALAVASEPRIFWDGNEDEARDIIGRINIPKELGYLEPAVNSLTALRQRFWMTIFLRLSVLPARMHGCVTACPKLA